MHENAPKLPERIVVRERIARLTGRNDGVVVDDVLGRRLFFKHNRGGSFARIVLEAERRRRDVSNILAARLLADHFAATPPLYRDAVLVGSDGVEIRGVVCDYLEGLQYLGDVAADAVADRVGALTAIVAIAWFGDLDRIDCGWNECVAPDGAFVPLDFDFCFSDGVSVLGTPRATRLSLQRFGAAEALAAAVDRIAVLSDEAIVGMVDGAGRGWVSDWSVADREHFAGVLIRNRDRLRRRPHFASRAIGPDSQPWSDLVTRAIRPISAVLKLRRLIRLQGFGATLRALAFGFR